MKFSDIRNIRLLGKYVYDLFGYFNGPKYMMSIPGFRFRRGGACLLYKNQVKNEMSLETTPL